MQDRGAAIVLEQELITFFQKYRIVDYQEISVAINERRFLDRSGGVSLSETYTMDDFLGIGLPCAVKSFSCRTLLLRP